MQDPVIKMNREEIIKLVFGEENEINRVQKSTFEELGRGAHRVKYKSPPEQ